MASNLGASAPPAAADPPPSSKALSKAGKPQKLRVKGRPPIFLRFRSSTSMISFVVATAILTDISGYGLIVPVVPFRLQALGYDGVGAKTGWLVAAYAGGLIVSSPPIAWLGTKIRSRKWLLIFFLFSMIGGVILFMETANFAAMAVSRILQGISATGIWTLGLCLITDSVPEAQVGAVMGRTMIGFSVGTLIGPPVGGVLYARMGYRAPFVFALCLLFVDLLLRLIVIEKHTAIKWIEAGYDIPNFEAAGYTPASNVEEPAETGEGEEAVLGVPVIPPKAGPEEEEEKADKAVPSAMTALGSMMTSPRALTCFALTVLNGFILGGTLDTAMALWLQEEYGLTSLGAGLAFLGAVVPTFFFSPLAGWGSDKYGAKWIAVIGLFLSIPAYSLLIIRGPLPLFIFFLALFGVAMSLFLAPTTQDLSVVIHSSPGLPPAVVHGSFNLCYSIGAFIGPIVAGQIIGALQIRRAWIVLCALSSGMAAILVPAVVLWMGGPLKSRTAKVEQEQELKETTA